MDPLPLPPPPVTIHFRLNFNHFLPDPPSPHLLDVINVWPLFSDVESHQIVRQAAADQVLRNQELYTESLNPLSKNREWADNHAIQAAADAFRVFIEIISSNLASFALVTVLAQGIPQNLVKKRIIIGHIDQVHFVSTEFNSPFATNSWGGYSKRLRKRLINTCPLDGPLIWLVNCA